MVKALCLGRNNRSAVGMPAQVRTLQLAFDIFLFFPRPVWPGWALITESDLPSYVSIDMESTFLLMGNSESAKPSRCCVVLMEKMAFQFGGGLASQPCSII